MNEESISIRSLQHYLYCPHRWGLLEIDKVWSENYYVTRANLIHQRVHDAKSGYTAKNKHVFTSVPLYHDSWGIYGYADCLETSAYAKSLEDLIGKPMTIVEYKPHQPKDKDYHSEDMMQVFAQKVCVDVIFKTDCDAVIYYADSKRRVLLPIREHYDAYRQKMQEILTAIRRHLTTGDIPSIRDKQFCGGCSIKDICLPGTRKRLWDLRREIYQLAEEET